MLVDRELLAFRQTYYGLFVRLLWQEPPPEVVAALREDLDARAAAAAEVHPWLGEGWALVAQFLATHPAEAVAEEFTRLFLGPYGVVLHPYESYYLTGRFFAEPLVALRRFLRRLGLEKQGLAEPEDVLAFELEVMRWLVGKQLAAATVSEAERWLRWQTAFLREHLLVWAPACAEDLERAPGVAFYRGVARMLRGFLDVEQELLRPWGLGEVPSLAVARQRYGSGAVWKGPTFDLDAGPAEEEEG
ncbi:MAG: hypothetical protein KatS3mg131_0554 [Candidatus Tectimicrobiota bacterium]|nr:MAG: hypothetical protein KatS3mg131_0554 [Candidatus Tectomicrobia bacterium]